MGSAYGESEKRLREVFEEAAKSAPSIIFIDEIDSIAPKRRQVHGEAEKRLVAQLLTLMDGLHAALQHRRHRRHQPPRRDRRSAAPARPVRPRNRDRRARRNAAGAKSWASTPAACRWAEDVDLDELARTTHGFVGADIAALAREAAIEAVRRIMPQLDLEAQTIPPEVLESLSVTRDDFLEALKRVQPTRDARSDGAGAQYRLGRHRRAGRGADEAEGRRRTAAAQSRGLPPAGHPPGQGLPALWPAGHRQDPAGQGGRQGGRGQLHLGQVLGPAEQMVWRKRTAALAPVRPRPPGRARV